MPDKIDDTIRIDGTDSNSEHGKTKRINEQNNTDAGITKRVETGAIIKAGLGSGLSADESESNLYELNGTAYRLIRKISEATSEAQIYLIEKDAEQFILKYYYPFIKPKLAVINKLRKISHPDIISVIDYGYYEERFFEILTYADQGSLAEQLPIKDSSKIKKYINEINNALKFCHDNGIIHRDIKPSNIFLKDKNRHDVVVGDFGIASIVDEGEVLRRTTIFQTPIYSAPEFKMSLRGETIITKAVDYYSLGITIWEMAAGGLPPDGMDELEFLREMFEGTPPLPNNLDSDIKTLIRGLTWRSYKQRWGFNEVVQWLNGEIPNLPDDKISDTNTMFLFDKDVKGNEIIAENTEQLARLIYENPEQGRKHLYRGTIKQWLKQNNDQNLLLEIADITEYKFKDDEKTGTQYAVYILDKNFPFYSLKNLPLRTKQELVDELRMNYKVYAPALKDPNHKFYLYLLSKNAQYNVEKFKTWYSEDEVEYAFYKILYTIEFSFNKNAPFAIFTSGKLKRLIKTIEELSDYFIENPKSRKPLFLSADFWVWLSFKNEEIESTLKEYYTKEEGASKNLLGLLPHLLLPEAGFKGLDGNRVSTLPELGREFYNHFEKYKKILRDDAAEIFFYLKAKGFDGEITFIKKCFAPQEKPSPYTDVSAMIKIIKGFEYDLPFIHRQKKYYSPGELLENIKITGALSEELSNQTSFLNLWLSVFFHEKPLSDDKKFYIYLREDYEYQLQEYLNFIRLLDKKNEITKRYESARKKLKVLRDKYSSPVKYLLAKKIMLYALPIIPAVLLILYSIFVKENPLPGNVLSIGSWYYFLWAIMVTLFLFKSMKESNDIDFTTGCIGGPIIGIIAAIISYYLCLLFISLPILLFIGLAGVFYFLLQSLKYHIDNYYFALETEKESMDPDRLTEMIYLFTFRRIEKISVEESDLMRKAKAAVLSARLKMLGYAVIPALLLGTLLLLLVYFTPNLNILDIFKGV